MNTTPKILFVDDDPNLLSAFARSLSGQFTFDTASGGARALEMLQQKGPYAVIVADMRMPVMDGLELLERVRQVAPETVRVMLTGNADQQTVVEAVNRGHVYTFLNKPVAPDELVEALQKALRQFEVKQAEREILETTLAGTTRTLAEVLGMVAPAALGRGQRRRDCMKVLARELEVGPAWEIEVAALLSTIGYASLPTGILATPRSELRDHERALESRVPQIGHDLLVSIPRLSHVAEIVLYQQKRYDGGGFPEDDRRGSGIPMPARMIKIISDRLDLEDDGVVKTRAYQTMSARIGEYDPRVLEACFKVFPDFLANSVSRDRAVQTLGLREVKPGQIAVSDIITNDGTVLVAAGNRLSPMMLQRLLNYGELNDVREPLLVQDEPAAA